MFTPFLAHLQAPASHSPRWVTAPIGLHGAIGASSFDLSSFYQPGKKGGQQVV